MDDSNYLPQLPLAHDETDGRLDTFMNRSIKRFLIKFYEVSDDATQNDTWLGFFDDDATVTMGMQTAKGSDGRWFLPSLWSVPRRVVVPARLLPALAFIPPPLRTPTGF